MQLIEVRYHDTVNVLQELFDTGSLGLPRGPFDRVQWYALLEETGLVPLIGAASLEGTSPERASAAIALTQTGGRIMPLRNWYNFTWRPLAPAGEVGDALLTEIASGLKNRSRRVTLEPVPDEDGSATRLSRAFANAGWRVEVTQCDTNHVLFANGRSFDEYWASRPGPLRTTLKRKAKKVETQVLEHFDPNHWEAFEAIYQSSWKPDEDQPAMLRKFATQEGEAGRLRLGIATREDQPVAAQFWTVENGQAYIHKLAHLERAAKFSAGTTLSAALFKHVIDKDKVKVVDFGTGTQRYKTDWMDAVRPRYKIDCFNLSNPRAWLDLARLTARRLTMQDPPALAPSPPQG